MKRFRLISLLLIALLAFVATSCGDDDDDDNDSGDDDSTDDDDDLVDDDDDNDDDAVDDDDDNDTVLPPALLPGPGELGYNAALEDLARMYDRAFHAFITPGQGVNTEAVVPAANTADRKLMEDFITETDGWDFEAYSGKAVFDVITSYAKVAGLYGGVGIAADAYRYGIYRDRGYPAAEAAIAREQLKTSIEALHIVTAITGVPGVVARGFTRIDIPGNAASTPLTPLFDGYGNPLPIEKDNGTWRADNSGGDYPEYIWEDSCSRDMFIGWCTALAAVWEVIKDDPEFSQATKDTLQEDARLIGMSFSTVQASGFDLEVMDADGRTTYHGMLNENAIDRIYLPWLPIDNGFNAVMALGCVSALAYAAEDEELNSYLNDVLVADRKLHKIFERQMVGSDLWIQSNFSGYNMEFQGAILASRYNANPAVQEAVAIALEIHMYDHEIFHLRQPREQQQSFYDFVYAAGIAGSNAWTPAHSEFDEEAVLNGTITLMSFPVPPYWDYAVENCDAAEIEAGWCEMLDGTMNRYFGPVGRNETVIMQDPVPFAISVPSNYTWRSCPYRPNGGGDGSLFLPGVDFRWAYWLGRWSR
jgi:hypothetical protein